MEGGNWVKYVVQKLIHDIRGKYAAYPRKFMWEKPKEIRGLEKGNALKYVLQKSDEIRGKWGDYIKYMSEKVKEARPLEEGNVVKYEILPAQIKNATLQDWITWVTVALMLALFLFIFCFVCLQFGHLMINIPALFVQMFCCCLGMVSWMIKTLALLVYRFCCLCFWMVFRIIKAFRSFIRWCCFWVDRNGFKMMKAPGRNFRIPRASFERNPRGYFRGLRAGAPLDYHKLPYFKRI